MVAIRSFMDTDAKGQVGGIECNEVARKRMAGESAGFRCPSCGKINAEIMREREEAAKSMEAGGEKMKEEVVPEELRLAYREDLDKDAAEGEGAAKGKEKVEGAIPASVPSTQVASPAVQSSTSSTIAPPPTRTVQLPQPPATQRSAEGSPTWIDHAIYGILAVLVFMVLRKVF